MKYGEGIDQKFQRSWDTRLHILYKAGNPPVEYVPWEGLKDTPSVILIRNTLVKVGSA